MAPKRVQALVEALNAKVQTNIRVGTWVMWALLQPKETQIFDVSSLGFDLGDCATIGKR